MGATPGSGLFLLGGSSSAVVFPTSAELNAGTNFAGELDVLPVGPVALESSGDLAVGGGTGLSCRSDE